MTSVDISYALILARQAAAEKGEVSGYASLDGSGKVPLIELPDLSGSYLLIDQSTPQSVTGGMPKFEDGLTVGPPGYLLCDGHLYLGQTDPTDNLQFTQFCDGINAYILRNLASDYSQFCYGINTVAGYAYIQSTHDGSGVVLPLTFWIHGDRIMDIASTGVGIGTDTPDTLLHLAKANATAIIRLERVDTTITTDDIIGRLEMEGQDAGAAGVCAKLEAIAEGNDGETGWRFSCGVAGSPAEVVRIDYLGNVGIGTVQPDAMLHIENVTGATQRLTRKDTTPTDDDIIGRIEFETQDAGGAGVAAFIQAEAEGSAGEVGVALGTGTGGAAVERVRIDHHGNLGLGISAFGTTAAGVFAAGIATAPTTRPANIAQMYVDNRSGVDGTASWHVMNEDGVTPYHLVDLYGEMYVYESAVEVEIDLANQYHAVNTIATGGICKGWVFKAGSTGPIASFANYHATVPNTTLINDVAHGLLTGEVITICKSTNYSGKHVITWVDADNFYIAVSYVAEAGGPNWIRGSSLQALPGSNGIYRIAWGATVIPVGANNNFKVESNLTTTDLDNMAASIRLTVAADRRTLTGVGLATVADGDYVWISVRNETDASNIIFRHCNLNVHKIG